jgi:hypothetical protein
MNLCQIIWAWLACDLNNSTDLVECRWARKDWSIQIEFCNHTANSPHVNTGTIFRWSEEHFRGSVPSGSHIVWQVRQAHIICLYWPGQWEIRQFNQAVSINQKVARFYITVNNSSSMQPLTIFKWNSLLLEISIATKWYIRFATPRRYLLWRPNVDHFRWIQL